MNNQTDVSIKFKNYVSGEKKLKQYAETLTQIKSVLKGIDTGTAKQLEKSATSTKETSEAVKNIDRHVKTAFNYTAVREFSRALQRTFSEMSRLVTKSTEYLENINLYQVAFEGNYKSADKFIDKMTEMYGLDESWLTRTVGIFKQLSNAMGVSAETGEKLSTLLTQMSLDISSLYNVDMERASSVLQSAMAGQTKPIRGLTGGDITQATLQTTLDNLGIERAVSTLSFAEKRLLIIISLTQQLNESIGDMGRTIESPANQMRVLNSQWERFSRALGNVVMPILSKILPYLNAIMMVLTEIINTIATFLGFKLEDYDYFGGTSDSVLELEENLDGATASANKLKQGLRGFDKLNVITTPTKANASVGSGIDPSIMDAFNKSFDDYQGKLEDVQMKATRIRDAILDWLGYTDGTYKNLKLIGVVLGTIGGLKIFKMLSGLFTGTSTLGKLLGTGGLYNSLTKLIKPIQILGAKDGLQYIFLTVKDAIIKFLPKLGGIAGIIGGIVRAGQGIKDLLDETKAKFDGIIKIIEGVGLAVTGVALLIGAWPVAIVGAIVTIGSFITEAIVNNWEKVKEFFANFYLGFKENIVDPIMNFLEPLTSFIKDKVIMPIIDFFKPIVEAIVSVFSLIFKNVADIVVGVGEAVWSIIKKVGEIFAKIVEIAIALGKAFYDYIISPIFDFVGKIATTVYEKAIKPIMGFFKSVGSWIYDNIIQPIVEKITWLKDKVVEIFKSIGTTVVNFVSGSLKSVINGVLGGFEKLINVFISMLNGAIDLINAIPGVEIKEVGKLNIPRLETGIDFVPKDYFGPVYLDYGERVLTKEENKNYSSNGANSNYQYKPTSFNPTFIVQVGDETVTKKVLRNLEDMAKTDGKPITIGG